MDMNTSSEQPQPRKAIPVLPDSETPSAAPAACSERETDENYRYTVANLKPDLRVIEGSCDLQWIVQRMRPSGVWVGFAFCGTKEGLLMRLPKQGEECNAKAWTLIEALPEFYVKGRRSGKVTERVCVG